MAYQLVLCRYCGSAEVIRYGTQSGRSRLRCKECKRIFKTDYVYRACEPGVKERIVDIAMNGGGVRDTATHPWRGQGNSDFSFKKNPAR